MVHFLHKLAGSPFRAAVERCYLLSLMYLNQLNQQTFIMHLSKITHYYKCTSFNFDTALKQECFPHFLLICLSCQEKHISLELKFSVFHSTKTNDLHRTEKRFTPKTAIMLFCPARLMCIFTISNNVNHKFCKYLVAN